MKDVEEAQKIEEPDSLRSINLLDLPFSRHGPLKDHGTDKHRQAQQAQKSQAAFQRTEEAHYRVQTGLLLQHRLLQLGIARPHSPLAPWPLRFGIWDASRAELSEMSNSLKM